MLLDHYVSAMDSWKGRIDSETDYDAFRWHQWVQPIDLNDGSAPFTGKLGFAFIGFCSDKGVARNKGRTGTALAPDFVRGQMSGLPCTFSQEVKLYDAGDIICDEISLEEGQRELGCAVAGDRDFGAAASPLGRLCLHAHELALTDPFTGEERTFRSGAPRGFRALVC